jgi:DNA-binding NarL/FixJ family response regulator/tetratricopeptide (TPR) repeat protein
MGIDESVSAGQAALQAGRWDDARAAFELDLCEQVTAEALLGMGEALWWLGEPHSSVDYHERAYAAFRRTGDTAQAAWTAMWLCLAYRSDFGNHAAASGWMARAERVLRDAEPGPMQGWLWLTHAYEAGDVERSRQFAERALEFAREADDLDLELCALGALGAALVEMGQIEKGLALVDEAMAGTLGGERSRLATVVFTSCSMLSACEIAADLERATQWCRVVDAFIRRYGCPFLHAYCRTAYGGILIATGHWEDAERELATAIRMTAEVWPAMQAQALTHLIGLRLRQGRLEEAEALLAGLEDDVAIAVPTATIRLARGDARAAAALLERRLERQHDGDGDAALASELLVGAHLALDDLDGASAAADRLTAMASAQSQEHIMARASLAAGRVAAAKGEVETAVKQLDAALERFSRLNMPLETARARFALAETLTMKSPAVAAVEAQIAFGTFDRLGAATDADAAAALLRSLGSTGRTSPRQPSVLTKREQEVLRLVGHGLSNPEIAQRLVISRKTAAHHVSSLLAKLGLRNRAEAVAYTTRNLGMPVPRGVAG